MKKFIFLVAVLLSGLYLHAQRSITNTLTEEHKVVPGSKVRVVVPKGFEYGQGFVGYIHPATQANVLVTEQPVGYEKFNANLTDENLMSRGVVLQNKETLVINGNKATLITATQLGNEGNYTKYILLYGSATECTLLSATIPASAPELAEIILSSLLSVLPGGR